MISVVKNNMNNLELDVRQKTALFRNWMKKLNEVMSMIDQFNVNPEEVHPELLHIKKETEAVKKDLKQSLEDYFNYEKLNPEIPKNFLFRKLYKTFF